MVAMVLSMLTAAGCGDDEAMTSTAASGPSASDQQPVNATAGDVSVTVDDATIEYGREVAYECTGGVVAGEELTLRGTGFQPGVPVVAQYSLAGSGEFVDAGESTAGADGSVAVRITVPDEPTGTTSGYELTGRGADGGLLLLNALVYFDGPGDECHP